MRVAEWARHSSDMTATVLLSGQSVGLGGLTARARCRILDKLNIVDKEGPFYMV